MTHEYTLLTGGTVIRGPGLADATAIAWAMATVLAVGSDEEVHAISRGDSHVLDLAGLVARAPGGGILAEGDDADLDLYAEDPRAAAAAEDARPVARIRGGHVVEGDVPAPR